MVNFYWLINSNREEVKEVNWFLTVVGAVADCLVCFFWVAPTRSLCQGNTSKEKRMRKAQFSSRHCRRTSKGGQCCPLLWTIRPPLISTTGRLLQRAVVLSCRWCLTLSYRFLCRRLTKRMVGRCDTNTHREWDGQKVAL